MPNIINAIVKKKNLLHGYLVLTILRTFVPFSSILSIYSHTRQQKYSHDNNSLTL